ncbi:MAG: acyl-CoA reductase, partial [Bdellovibrionales bacterium]
MTLFYRLLPTPQETTLEALTSDLQKAKAKPLGIAHKEVTDFCGALSAFLLNDVAARRFADLQALGFWLRPASIAKLTEHATAMLPDRLRVPQGTVFQLSPGNVPTLFGYHAILSLLCGNATLVRLPSRTSDAQRLLLEGIYRTLPETLAPYLYFLRYEHDDTLTQGLSSLCNVRMSWGGDATVAHIRSIPLPPLAREIGFANRFSLAALSAEKFLALDEAETTTLAQKLITDLFEFDQMACSSPRLLIWIGQDKDRTLAATRLYPRLAELALQKYGAPDASANIAKLNAAFLALHDLQVRKKTTFTPALTVLSLSSWHGMEAFRSLEFGHGLLLDQRLDTLAALADYVQPK